LNNWQEEFDGAITFCDSDNKIVYMNNKSKETFSKYGGGDLIGTNLLAYHSEESKKKIGEIIESKKVNAYTIEKEGKKKLIYQAPCFENDQYIGLLELSLEIPYNMPHFVRE